MYDLSMKLIGGQKASHVSVIIPVYNEAGSVAAVVDRVRKTLREARIAHEIVVVDDGSRDGGPVVNGPGVRVVKHPYNLGYGAALKTGLAETDGEWVAILDGDGTYPPEELPRLLANLPDHAMAVGARADRGGGGLLRRGAREFLRRLAQYLTGREIPDLNSGLRVFHRSEAVRFLPILPSGFSFTTTITIAMMSDHRPVCFLPISYGVRNAGQSKIRPFQDTLNFLSLVVRVVAYFDPLKVFIPIAASVFLLGVVEAGYFFYREGTPYFSKSTIMLLLASLLFLGVGLLADLIVARTRMLMTPLNGRKDRGA